MQCSERMNLIICGDFENGPFALEIDDDPSKTLVSYIKEKVAETIDVPSAEMSLYFGDEVLKENSPLSQWKELRGGAAVLVVANPLRIKIQRYCSDVDVNLEIPRLAAPRLTTDTLFNMCLYKSGMPFYKDGEYVFAVKGIVLKQGRLLSEYKFLNNNFTISVTFVKALHCCDALSQQYQSSHRTFHLPSAACIDNTLTCEQKMHNIIYKDRNCQSAGLGFKFGNDLYQQGRKRASFNKWKLAVQKIDGTKETVELENHFLTPVFELRHKVSHGNAKVRLTFGRTILEDWDSEGNMMLLCNYPDLHDGATLYQVNLTGAIRIHCHHKGSSFGMMKLHDQLDHALHECFTITNPQYIFIEDPDHFTVNRLFNALRNIGKETCTLTENQTRILPSDRAISSVGELYDGCRIYNHYRRR